MSIQTTTEPDSNGINDYPAHWQATLLGEDFWKDAEEWNKDTNNQIETDHDQTLHTRFPFNIGLEQTQALITRAPSIITTTADADEEIEALPSIPEKRNRRFSMNDALNVKPFTSRSGTSLLSGSRVFELGRLSRSQSRSNNQLRSSSVVADVRRSNSMIRSTLSRLSGRNKVVEEEEETEEGDEVEIETEEPSPVLPLYDDEQATPANPLMEFRGGILWTALAKDRRALGLDIFWPMPIDTTSDNKGNEHKTRYRATGGKQEGPPSEGKEKAGVEEEQPPIFHIDNMAPLCMFRNLRVLKITGMMQSYQMYIFQAAWLNPNLEELEIGMALPPRLSRRYKWPYIKGGWRLDKATYAEPIYNGTGEGSLLRHVGVAEYLDKVCLEKAKIRAMAMGPTRNHLSIRTLILTGVVIDADPFLHWFDPKRLKTINFKDNCVDAGFYLNHCMRKVSVLFPRQLKEPVETFSVRRVNPLKELKVVELKGGKKVGEAQYTGKESLKTEITDIAVVKIDEKNAAEGDQKSKMAEIEMMEKSMGKENEVRPDGHLAVVV